MLAERGRVQIQGRFRDWVSKAQARFPTHEAHLNHEIALSSRELDLPHADPADRFLAATSVVYELTLLTVDQRLTEASWLDTRSR